MRVCYGKFVVFLFVVTGPLLLIIGMAIAVISGLPILFRQRRAGLNGKPFILYKFRTMRKSAEKEQYIYRKQNEANGPVFKIHNDPRFTPIGRFLSHTGLDELPQLWNVLVGDMALIGPRPLPVEEAEKLSLWMKKRHSIKPGIVSPWIFEGYHNRTFSEWMKSDLSYIKHKSFWYDFSLTKKAVVLVFRLISHELSGN